MTPANLGTVERLRGWCDTRGIGMTDLAFAWLLAKPAVSSVIAGATKPEQLEQNVKADETKHPAGELAGVAKLWEGRPARSRVGKEGVRTIPPRGAPDKEKK